MNSNSNCFNRVRRQREIDNRMANDLYLLTPQFVAAIEEPAERHTRRSIQRDHARGYEDLWNRYFKPDSMYSESMFRRRFHMRRDLFFRIQTDIEQAEPYFIQRWNAAGRLGLHSLQKMIVSLRMLAYGAPTDSMDECFQIAEATAVESMKIFCKTIVRLYRDQYLREPNEVDLARLFEEGEARGFPGMLGSLDCMHWTWKNCPTAWHGAYRGHHGAPTMILEAVTSHDLWIWHAYFGMPGSNNDITVLDHSPLFQSFLHERNSNYRFDENGNEYSTPYYLTDGIYPPWSTLIQSVSAPRTQKEKYFAKKQEGVRKDVERAFGVLQAKWSILKGSARFWKRKELHDIMLTCLILHNMMIDDERHTNLEDWRPLPNEPRDDTLDDGGDHEVMAAFLSARLWALRDRETNHQLKSDLIDHLWTRKGLDDEA